ncbi:MAG TPA: hypothetical protein VFZ53_30790, partial [Polyangiaceae bacterium]
PSSGAPSGLTKEAPSAGPAAALPPPAPSGDVSPSASYLVSVDTQGCPLEIRINDVPLRELEGGRPHAFGEIVDPWLKSGVNTVSLAAREPVSKDCASLVVLAVPEGGDQRTAPRVLDTKWPPAELARGEQAFEFHGPAAERCRLWRDIEPLELSAGAQAEILADVRALHALFSQKKVAAFAERTDYRAQDIARCFRKSPESGVDDQKKFLTLVTSESRFVPLPLDETALVLDLVGGGRLVWVHRRDTKLLFQNGMQQGMDLYWAKLGGRFTVVR